MGRRRGGKKKSVNLEGGNFGKSEGILMVLTSSYDKIRVFR